MSIPRKRTRGIGQEDCVVVYIPARNKTAPLVERRPRHCDRTALTGGPA